LPALTLASALRECHICIEANLRWKKRAPICLTSKGAHRHADLGRQAPHDAFDPNRRPTRINGEQSDCIAHGDYLDLPADAFATEHTS